MRKVAGAVSYAFSGCVSSGRKGQQVEKFEVGDIVAYRESDSVIDFSRRAKVTDIKPSGKT